MCMTSTSLLTLSSDSVQGNPGTFCVPTGTPGWRAKLQDDWQLCMSGKQTCIVIVSVGVPLPDAVDTGS